MFETLFRYPAVRQRHADGPLATERAAYLAGLAARGHAPGTLLKCARYCLAIAHQLQSAASDRSFTTADVDRLADVWPARRVSDGHAAAEQWPREHFRAIATEFLRMLGRWTPPPAVVQPYAQEIDDFVMTEQRDRLRSPRTTRNRRWHIERFLSYLVQRTGTLAAVTPVHLDAHLQHAAARWSRVSLRSAAFALRVWFRHCEARGWVRSGLSAAILIPRVYRDEGIPIGPSWAYVARLIGDAEGDTPRHLRDAAMLRLLAMYGLRSGEIRRLRIHDVDWARHRLGIARSKSGRHETFPLESTVERALDRYVRHGRPTSHHETLFLTVKAPVRPLSAGALYHLVQARTAIPGRPSKGRGPHGLRPACARQLIEAGLSFKAVGDHLGHRSPDSTRIYAKVDLTALRRVAMDDLGGLV